MNHYQKFALLGIMLCFAHCGKRSKNFFNFDPPAPPAHLKRFDFPSIKKSDAHACPHGIEITWEEISHEQLVGYNVYRFFHDSFIPHRPLNKIPLVTHSFFDEAFYKTPPHYIIRGVFFVDDKIVQGPSSKVVIGK